MTHTEHKETEQSVKEEAAEPKEEKKVIKEDKLAEYKETLQRLQAEFENYRKRTEKETAEMRRFATSDIITQLLPILDSFELALTKADTNDETVKGFELIYSQLFGILEKEGLTKIDSAGQAFDPTLHEALMQEEHDGEDNKVLEEFQKGYVLHDRVLRAARVKVSKQKSDGNKEGHTRKTDHQAC